MPEKMGLQFGLESSANKTCKRKFRWLFRIPEVSADGIDTLPPLKSARPTLLFKEMVVKHLIEDVYYPAKPDWKPIQITLYDLKENTAPAGTTGNRTRNLMFQWIREFYRPGTGLGELDLPNERRFIKTCTLTMLDGCGETVETWVFEDAWPQSTNFQTLDMGDSGIATIDISLRYARAYVEDNGGSDIALRDNPRNTPQGRNAQIAFTS
jgi:hypothetical protein